MRDAKSVDVIAQFVPAGAAALATGELTGPAREPGDAAGDPSGAAAVNALLVADGVRVTQIIPERRSLEQMVLTITGAGSDRIDADAGRHSGPDDEAEGSR